MNFSFSHEQEELRRLARRWMEEKSPSSKVRDLIESEEGFDARQWKEIAALGWVAMAIPEEWGGAGYGFLEQAVLLEEMGRALWPSPYFSTAVMAARLFLAAGEEAQKTRYLPAIAAGELTATVASIESNGRWDESGIEAVAIPESGGWRLSGVKSFVLDGHAADLLIVAARSPEGVSLFLVEGDDPHLERRLLETMDQTRKLAEITIDGAAIGSDRLLGEAGGGWPLLEKGYAVAVVGQALEQVGGAQRCLDMAVEYAKVRHQFGRPIGSFQAIKHKCADMLVQVESARSAAYYAAWAVSEDNDEVPLVAPLAKSYCSEAYFFCASENIQIHGGIGFTWEHDAHLYFKRAKSSELMFGDPSYHRAILADRIGL